jgi:hypothetical protein
MQLPSAHPVMAGAPTGMTGRKLLPSAAFKVQSIR